MVSSSCRNHALILVVISMVALSVRFALNERYAEERRTIDRKGQIKRARELAARWNSLRYVKAETAELSDAFTAKIDWAALKLSDHQRTKLERRFGELFEYLQKPSVEAYYRLKTEGFRFEFELSTNASRLLRAKQQVTDATETRQPMEVVRSLWEVVHKAGAGASSCLTEICLDHIAVASGSTNSFSAILNGKACKGFTIVQEAMDPGFIYTGASSSGSADSVENLYVNLSFFARSSASTNAGPVYSSLRWSEAEENWIPSRMFTDILLNMNLLF